VTAPDAHERFAELAAGHALDALEPADEQAFLAHLPTCPECQHAVDWHTETLGHLAHAAEPVELPPAILEGIRREIGATEEGRGATAAAAEAPVQLDTARVRRRRPSLDSRALIGAAAAVALVLALGGWNLALHRDRSQADQRARQLAAAVSVLEQPATSRVGLTDSRGRPVALALVRADSSVALVVDGLAPNDRSRSTYVLWQQVGTGMRAVGAFDVRGGQVDVVTDLRLAAGATAPGFAVTREPGRTVPAAPGSDPIATGGLSA
jgi:hypothetical protein